MPLNAAAKTVAANAYKTALTYAQCHSVADPGGSGTTSPVGMRVTIPWGTVTSGNLPLASPVNFTGLTPNQAIGSISFWSASSAGTYYGYAVPTGDATANSEGEYSLTAISLTAI